MRAFSTDKQMQGLSHLRFVSFTVDQMFLAQIIIHEFFIHVMFYVSHMIIDKKCILEKFANFCSDSTGVNV